MAELKNIEIKQNFKEMKPLENWIDSFENVIPNKVVPIAEIKELKALNIKLKIKEKEVCNCETCKKISKIYAVMKKLDSEDKKTIEELLMDLVYTEEDYSLYKTLYPGVSCAFLCELQTRDLLKDFQKDVNDLFEKYKKQFKNQNIKHYARNNGIQREQINYT